MLSDTELTRVVTDEMSAFDVKALVERLADPAILVGPDRIISAANNHVESLFGWEETGLVGQLIDVLIPSSIGSSHTDWVNAFFERPAARSMSENPVIEGVHKDGSRVRIDISLTPIPGAATPLVLAVIHDTSVLINRYERRANELRAFTEIANLIKTGLDAHEVMERLSRQVRNLIPYDRFVVVTFDRVNSMVQDWFVAGQNASSHDPWSRYQLNTDQVRDYLGMKRAFITRSNSEHTLLSSMESNVERFKQGFRSLLCAPLIWNDEVLGVINFRSKSETAYDEDSLAIADQISAVAAAALGRKAFLATTSQADHHRAVLSNISRIISQASDIQSVFDSVALQVDQVIPIERMVLASLNSDRTGYFDEAEWGQKTVNTATSVMNDLRGSATEWRC